jgi:prevent-host-death family protein
MNATVEQLESEWRRLIETARRGEEVVLTSHGKPVARLTGVPQPPLAQDRHRWLAELANLRQSVATDKTTPTTDQILDDLRSERG